MNRLPSDIENIIMNMVFHSNHYDKYKLVLKQMLIQISNRLFSKLYIQYLLSHETYFTHYIKQNVSFEYRNELLYIFSQCKCCERHQTYRPNNINSKPETYEYIQRIKTQKECNCDCRKNARYLLRAEYYDVFDIERDRRMILYHDYISKCNHFDNLAKKRKDLTKLRNIELSNINKNIYCKDFKQKADIIKSIDYDISMINQYMNEYFDSMTHLLDKIELHIEEFNDIHLEYDNEFTICSNQ